jgi:xanthine/uracil/vitamin C permease (AzgA family)
MINKYKNFLILFCSSFIQLFLGAYNIWQIANDLPIQVTIVGFLIAFIWTFNVKRVSVSTMPERIVYSIGAGIGTTLGMIFAKEINSFFYKG